MLCFLICFNAVFVLNNSGILQVLDETGVKLQAGGIDVAR